jgi:hypothetical protein
LQVHQYEKFLSAVFNFAPLRLSPFAFLSSNPDPGSRKPQKAGARAMECYGGFEVPAESVEILQDVIRNVHGCESRHIETVHVCQELEGHPVWTGDVEIFELSAPLAGRKCFAWGYLEERPRKQRRYVTVLEAPAVVSAQDAVRASLVSDARAWPN